MRTNDIIRKIQGRPIRRKTRAAVKSFRATHEQKNINKARVIADDLYSGLGEYSATFANVNFGEVT